MTEVYYYFLPQKPAEWEEKCNELLCFQKTDRLYQKKRSSLYGKIISRGVSASRLGVCKDSLEMAVDDFGRPFFKDIVGLDFNISHSKSLVAVAVSDYKVGVDAEYIRELKQGVDERFFTENERALIKNDRDFFLIWTKKEAYIKQSGKGFKIPLTSFDTNDSRLASKYSSFEKNGYIISVFTEEKENKISFIELSDKEIREYKA